jgi:3-phenylpropionate/cinnamic acid dioxygenase small subunit
MRDSKPDHFVPVGAGVYHDIQHFLFREAYLLDQERYGEWVTLLAEDLVYRTPAEAVHSFNDDYRSIRERVGHLSDVKTVGGPSARPRRFITNIIVCVAGCCDEYEVLSYVLITRARNDGTERLLSAERHDHLRRAAQSFRIFRREIFLDAGASAVPIFL